MELTERYPVLRHSFKDSSSIILKFNLRSLIKLTSDDDVVEMCYNKIVDGTMKRLLSNNSVLIFDNEGDVVKMRYDVKKKKYKFSLGNQYSKFTLRNIYRNDSYGHRYNIPFDQFVNIFKKSNKLDKFIYTRFIEYTEDEMLNFYTKYILNKVTLDSVNGNVTSELRNKVSTVRTLFMFSYYSINPFIIQVPGDKTNKPKKSRISKPKDDNVITILPNHHIKTYRSGVTILDTRNNRIYKSIVLCCEMNNLTEQYQTITRQTREDIHPYFKRIQTI